MNVFNPNPDIPPRVLATDLDGTLIPLPGHDEHLAALDRFRQARAERRLGLVFATGRHLASVQEAMEHDRLPVPDWIVCDVGTSIHHRHDDAFEPYQPFVSHLTDTTHGVDRAAVETLLADLGGLTLQSSERQQPFKVSYVSEPNEAPDLAQEATQRLEQAGLPYACHASLDPFHGVGLLDVLPIGASKATALIWLSTHADFLADEVVFAGDSGNDLPALTCGFRAIVVANATPGLADRAEAELGEKGLAQRLYRASASATSGVLQGCRHFGLLPPAGSGLA